MGLTINNSRTEFSRSENNATRCAESNNLNGNVFTTKPTENNKSSKSTTQEAIAKLEKQGYKITDEGNGKYLKEDNLHHKTYITGLCIDDYGKVQYMDLQVQIVEKRFQKRLFGEKDTPEEAAKYKKEAMDIMKKAGFILKPLEGEDYMLTKPDGTEIKITNITLDLDGGATWTTVPQPYKPGSPKEFIYE